MVDVVVAGVPAQRVMLLRAPLPTGGFSVGSGTLVGPGLVLTAAHVVFADDGAALAGVRVGPPEDLELFTARVVWPDSYQQGDDPAARRDVALVVIEDPRWVPPRLGPVRWGRLTGRAPVGHCAAVGFPRVLRDPDGTRDSDGITGSVHPGSRRVARRYDLSVTSSLPAGVDPVERSPWSGASGAGLFAAGLLIGVLVVDERTYQGRLSALPVHLLAADPAFTAIVAEHGAGEATPARLGSVELAGLLSPAARTVAPRRGRDASPAGLLRADAEAVPFHGRGELLGELNAWCADPAPVDLRLLIGPGGQGKTRLAQRLAQRLAGRPDPDGGLWVTGTLAADPPTAAPAPDLGVLADTDGSLLVVVDYAETRAGQVARLMEALWAADASGRARVVLLARAAGDWWTRLTDDLHLSTAARVTALPGLDPSGDPAAGFTAAVAALAERLPDLIPGVDWASLAATVPVPSALATDPRYRVPLTLQLTGLTGLLEAAQRRAVPGEPAEATLLSHERSYWRNSAATAGLNLADPTLGECVATATLCGSSTLEQARGLLAAVPSLHGQSADMLARVDTWLRGVYPPHPGQHWGGIEPDRVGEYQVGTVLLPSPGLLATLLAAAAPAQIEHALTVLARAAANPALTGEQIDQLTDQLAQVTREDLARYGPAAVTVATQAARPEPILTALQRASQDATTDQLRALSDAVPPSSVALAALAAHWAGHQVHQARAQHAADPDDTTAAADLAASLNNLSVRLSGLGRREDALTAIEEAVQLRRTLATAHPDAFTPNLAASLNNLSNQLSDLGRREEALTAIEEAVQAYRALATAHPDAFTPDLAASLNNLSN
ncbi:MAG: tetratricopeptide repeat protein, partial [Dermatophilaceae bacterium]